MQTSSDSRDDDADLRFVLFLLQMVVQPGAGDLFTPDDAVLDEYPSHHQLCSLYRECLQYLQDTYPVASLDCSVAGNLQESTMLRDLPSCFGTLVNSMADARRYVHSTDTLEFDPDIPPFPHALTVIVVAIAATQKYYHMEHKTGRHCQASHLLCAFLPSPIGESDTEESDLYHGLLFDCLAHHTTYWNMIRGRDMDSPMPYSQVSLQELALPEEQTSSENYVVTTHDLAHAAIDTSLPTSGAWTIGLPVDIPWLGARHDGYPFFPSLSKYTATRRPKGVVHSFHDDAALWLGTMTFGLLEAITRMRIPEHILLVPAANKGEAVISGTRILQVLVLWLARTTRVGGDGLQRDFEYGREAAQLWRRALQVLTDDSLARIIFVYAQIPDDKLTDIRHGIAHLLVILLGLMQNDKLIGWGSLLPEIAESISPFSGSSDSWRMYHLIPWYRQMLLDVGWCPYTLSIINLNTSEGILIGAALVPHLIRLRPYIRTKLDEHIGCTADACVLHTITDTDEYKCRHVQPACECGDIKPPLFDVLRLLNDGIVPVVIYDGSALRVVPAQDKSYVAISHVWSEGMGSTTEDGLPICLVEHISNLARSLLPEHNGAFWMDSLCVPSARQQRKQAIRLMADTYRNAAKVLVIDNSVRTMCHSERSPAPEILLRIATSAWMRRIWTLQEGILARELYFEFTNGAAAVNFAKLISAEPRGCDRAFVDLAPVLTWREAHHGPLIFSDRPPSMIEVVSLLHGRSTTKDEDELIAISSLLPPRVKIDELLAESDGSNLAERRMKVFLLRMRDIPLAITFGSCPRSTIEGFSWAPRMLSVDVYGSWSDSDGAGICTEDGLVGKYHLALFNKAVTLTPPDTNAHDRASSTVIDSDYARAGCILIWHPQSKSFLWLIPGADSSWTSSFDALLLSPQSAASLANTEKSESLILCIGVSRLHTDATTRTIVRINGTSEKHPIAVKYITRCAIERAKPSIQEELEQKRIMAERLGDLREVWIRLVTASDGSRGGTSICWKGNIICDTLNMPLWALLSTHPSWLEIRDSRSNINSAPPIEREVLYAERAAPAVQPTTSHPPQASDNTPTKFPNQSSADTATEHPVQTSADVPCDGTLPQWLRALRQLDTQVATGAPVLDDSILDQYPFHHELCHLYRDCLDFLQGRYPVASLDYSLPEDLRRTPIWDFPVCFGTLVNFIADFFPIEFSPDDPEHLSTFAQWLAPGVERFLPPCPHALGLLAHALSDAWDYRVMHKPDHDSPIPYLLCILLVSPPGGCPPAALDLYHALFLECLTSHLRDVCFSRAMKTATLMPYSLESLQELQIPAQASSGTFVVDEGALPCSNRDASARVIAFIKSLEWTIGLPNDIPWLGARHDGHPFCSSLSNYVALRRPKGAVHSLYDDAALWLSAMTFGLLEAITQMQIPERILLAPGANEETVISGSRIFQVLILWIARKKQGYGGRQRDLEHGREVARLLRRTLRVLGEEEREGVPSFLSYAKVTGGKDRAVLCGIAHLVVILWELMRKNDLTGWACLPELGFTIEYLSDAEGTALHDLLVPWYQKQLAEVGWCPYTLSILQPNLSAMTPLFPHLLSLRPYIRSSLGEHASCREDVCVFHTVTDTDMYKLRHARPSCDCANVKPPLDDVLRLLDGGIVPVVVYEGSVLRVIPAQETSYVAISHVWSEGMGSTTDVGLPACLVAHISDLVRRLVPEHGGAFWMDSLCVPSAREQRKRAIKLMADTYRNASKVLVIDDSVRTMCYSERAGTPWTEILLRVTTSAWVRRVWTLQEGLLARELFFEFIDGPASVSMDHSRLSSAALVSLAPVLIVRAGASENRFAFELPTMMLLLQNRTTTKAEDEIIAISSLLRSPIDVGDLLAERDGPYLVERRLKLLLLHTRDIPLTVPFGSCPRAELDGLSWAPRMLSADAVGSWNSQLGTGIYTEQGLVGKYHLALFEKPITMPPDPSAVEDSTESVASSLTRTGIAIISHFRSGSLHTLALNGPSLELSPKYTFNALLFLLVDSEPPFPIATAHTICIGVRYLPDVDAATILQADSTSREHPIAVKYIARCAICRLNPTRQKILEAEHVSTQGLGDPKEVWVRLS
ncbi:hypothetical protein ONZ51_g11461 [Trametes cubensis]|uniref:Heterokaryon incompatibility domain-containing protein n=1 Tax=Trametes cubensis TaxID=1111947 RepID=A0AAD7X432_9APHY|nr:hypothetical protein ONZ51_g11461 [Trametes cubensis]